jgi:rhodanese-related sulfurtransferase
MPLSTIPPREAKELIEKGAILVDIRNPDEHARERIPAANLHPLSTINTDSIGDGVPAVIFHCRSGFRTTANAAVLASGAKCKSYALEGGLEAWRDTGLPTIKDTKRPIEIIRQVQILVGSFILMAILLGALVNPAFNYIAAAMGGGLVIAGITGWCGMAKVLTFLPMNRQPVKAGSGA